MQEICNKEGLRVNDVSVKGRQETAGVGNSAEVHSKADSARGCSKCSYHSDCACGHATFPPLFLNPPAPPLPPHVPAQATMTALVEGASGDLRLLLGQLQMVRLSRTTLSYADGQGKQVSGLGGGGFRV